MASIVGHQYTQCSSSSPTTGAEPCVSGAPICRTQHAVGGHFHVLQRRLLLHEMPPTDVCYTYAARTVLYAHGASSTAARAALHSDAAVYIHTALHAIVALALLAYSAVYYAIVAHALLA